MFRSPWFQPGRIAHRRSIGRRSQHKKIFTSHLHCGVQSPTFALPFWKEVVKSKDWRVSEKLKLTVMNQDREVGVYQTFFEWMIIDSGPSDVKVGELISLKQKKNRRVMRRCSIEGTSEKGIKHTLRLRFDLLKSGWRSVAPASPRRKPKAKRWKIITMESLILAQDER